MRYIDSTTSTISSSRFSSTEIVGARELALLWPGKPNKSKLSEYIRQTAASHPKFASKNKYLCPFLSFSMLPSLLKRIYTDIKNHDGKNKLFFLLSSSLRGDLEAFVSTTRGNKATAKILVHTKLWYECVG